jgi:peptidoglycan/xylan/chitin deacetylase (PgdA/CDA1 family)
MQTHPIAARVKSIVRKSLYYSGAASVVRSIRRSRFAGCRVINFHRILRNDVPPEYYARHMSEPTAAELEELLVHLRRWFHFISPREFLDAVIGLRSLDPYSLILTFDDGHVDFYERLVPLLDRLGVPATVFINTAAMAGETLWFQKLFAAVIHSPLEDFPGGLGVPALPLTTVAQRIRAIKEFAIIHQRLPPEQWDELVPRICDAFHWNGNLHDERMLTWEQLESMRKCPWITVGGHTVSHPFLPRCDDNRLQSELVQCARELRQRLRLDFLPFSYPNGGSDPRVASAVEKAGYDCSFSIVPGLNTLRTPRHQLFRHYVAPNVIGASFDLSFRVPLGGPE